MINKILSWVIAVLILVGMASAFYLFDLVQKQNEKLKIQQELILYGDSLLQINYNRLDSINQLYLASEAKLADLSDAEKREKERIQRNRKYYLGLSAFTNSADYNELVTYLINEGFNAVFPPKKETSKKYSHALLLYYSDDEETLQVVNSLKKGIEDRFEISFDVQRGGSGSGIPPNVLDHTILIRYTR